jgi:hypothetical protein
LVSVLLDQRQNYNTPFIGSEGATNLLFTTNATERMRIDSVGNVGIGADSLTGYTLRVAKPLTGAVTVGSFVANGAIQSDVTNIAYNFQSLPSIVNAAFTLGTLNHFAAGLQLLVLVQLLQTKLVIWFLQALLVLVPTTTVFRAILLVALTVGTYIWVVLLQNYVRGRLGIGTTTSGAMLRVQNDAAGNHTVLLRNAAGQSGSSFIIQDSAGAQFFGIGTTGNVGIGNVLSTSAILRIQKTITGSPYPVGYYITSAIDSDYPGGVVNGNGYYSAVGATSTNVASPPNVPNIHHHYVAQGTFTNTTVTSQYGYYADGNLTGATNNYAYFGNIAAAAGRWNLHMGGGAQNYLAGNLGIGVSVPTSKLHVVGSFSRGAPVTKTASFTLANTENWLICNGTASITVTLPAASTQVGREITIKTIAAFTVVSASSNIVPLTGGAAGTAILPASAGAWAKLVSDGTNWIIMQS